MITINALSIGIILPELPLTVIIYIAGDTLLSTFFLDLFREHKILLKRT